MINSRQYTNSFCVSLEGRDVQQMPDLQPRAYRKFKPSIQEQLEDFVTIVCYYGSQGCLPECVGRLEIGTIL